MRKSTTIRRKRKKNPKGMSGFMVGVGVAIAAFFIASKVAPSLNVYSAPGVVSLGVVGGVSYAMGEEAGLLGAASIMGLLVWVGRSGGF